MKTIYILIKIFSLILVFNMCFCTGQGKVVELNDENFEEHRLKHEYILIYFHATYSEQSKFLQVQFKRLPNNISTDKDILYSIISQKNYLVNHKYNVEFPYPKIILVNKDNYYEYKGEINTNSIGDWVLRKLNKQLYNINSSNELVKLIEDMERIVCVVGENNLISKFNNETSLTETFTDLQFFTINSETVLSELNIEQSNKNLNPKLIIFKTYDELFNVYNGDILMSNTTEKFIRTYAYPVLNQFSATNYLYVINNQISFSVLLLPSGILPENSKNLMDQFYNNGKKNRDQLFFMFGNYSDQSQTTLAIDFEIQESDLPAVIIHEFSKEKIIKRYKLDKLSLDDSNEMVQFFDKYKYGALKRFLKSEKLPSNADLFKENIYQLVRKNFEEVIVKQNADKFALVYFYRRNCGPCIEHKKDFIRISKKLWKQKKIIFAVIDGISNEFDEFEINGFPSVILFKPGKNKLKNFILFDSLLTFENLESFLQDHLGKAVIYMKDDL